mgnify:CR=1 FL=1
MKRQNLGSSILGFSFFLGGFGAHRFYVGKMGTAVLQIVTLGGLGIWVLIDLILIAKNLERVADHATNIAEDVILTAESLNVKHSEKLATMGEPAP